MSVKRRRKNRSSFRGGRANVKKNINKTRIRFLTVFFLLITAMYHRYATAVLYHDGVLKTTPPECESAAGLGLVSIIVTLKLW